MSTKNYLFNSYTLAQLGFSHYFSSQLSLDDFEQLRPMRLAEVQRDRVHALSENGLVELTLQGSESIADFTVGDWVLVNEQNRIARRLDPKSSLSRRAAGTGAAVQKIANNVDTLFIVTSCNADFNEARLERYLALSREAGVEAVILLTKADLSNQVEQLQQKAQALMRQVVVLPINATDNSVISELEPWCGSGQTIALLGSSGVGKTTLLNALSGDTAATQGIREDDSKGKHTTTFRSMRATIYGGWVIDTPGMRALRLQETADGINAVFDEITETAKHCRYADCLHISEPGCAVKTAIESGELDAERLKRWRKLQREDLHNSQTVADARKRDKQFSKSVDRVIKGKQARKDSFR